jgi:O-antigen ligase
MPLNQKIFYWVYLSGLFLITALPFLALPPLFHPADWGKSIIFRIIFSILLFVFIAQILYQKQYKLFIYEKIKAIPRLFLIPFAVFIILLILSTIFSLEPFFSFWGSPYRAGGSLNLLLYLVLAIFSYLVVKKEDWKKVLTCAIIAGLAVSFLAIAQQLQFKEGVLVSYITRPPSTMGNTNFLAVYLIFLLFLAFTYGIKEKIPIKKLFYLGSSAIFLLVIVLTVSRAAFIGIILGFFWVLFFTKFRNPLFNKLKIILAILPIIILSLLFFIANNPSISSKITQQDKPTEFYFLSRFSFNLLSDVRFSAWRVGLDALKDRPILGYGPENFSIGFDKFYNPYLPGLNSVGGGVWWDRAHNFLLDIGVTLGVPALLAYIIFWIALILKLQKKKEGNSFEDLNPHILQAMFIAYFGANFFGFDCVPTYIISFLLVGYCLSLISVNEDKVTTSKNRPEIKNTTGKNIFIAGLFIFLIFFIWQYNIKPLKINASINWANYYLEQDKTCNRANNGLKPYLESHSIVSSYLYQIYGNVLTRCTKDTGKTEDKVKLVQQGIEIDKKLIKERPYFTRSYIYLGAYESFLLEKDTSNKDLEDRMNNYFIKAVKLSPNRPSVFSEWSKAYLTYGNCQESLNMANKCLSLNNTINDCWWISGLSNICLKNQQLGEEQIKMAEKKGYDNSGTVAMKQLVKIYTQLIEGERGDKTLYYKALAEAYYRLTQLNPDNFQYHASLAYVYKALGEYQKARQEALIVIKLSPESKQNVDAFLRTLPY